MFLQCRVSSVRAVDRLPEEAQGHVVCYRESTDADSQSDLGFFFSHCFCLRMVLSVLAVAKGLAVDGSIVFNSTAKNRAVQHFGCMFSQFLIILIRVSLRPECLLKLEGRKWDVGEVIACKRLQMIIHSCLEN
jgi:hypothetical protein